MTSGKPKKCVLNIHIHASIIHVQVFYSQYLKAKYPQGSRKQLERKTLQTHGKYFTFHFFLVDGVAI